MNRLLIVYKCLLVFLWFNLLLLVWFKIIEWEVMKFALFWVVYVKVLLFLVICDTFILPYLRIRWLRSKRKVWSSLGRHIFLCLIVKTRNLICLIMKIYYTIRLVILWAYISWYLLLIIKFVLDKLRWLSVVVTFFLFYWYFVGSVLETIDLLINFNLIYVLLVIHSHFHKQRVLLIELLISCLILLRL